MRITVEFVIVFSKWVPLRDMSLSQVFSQAVFKMVMSYAMGKYIYKWNAASSQWCL